MVLKRVHNVIQFNQKAWLKPYIDMDTKLKAEAKNYFFNLISKAVFGKILENIRKQKDIKLVTANQKEMV